MSSDDQAQEIAKEKKHKKSVRSLTREYEANITPTTPIAVGSSTGGSLSLLPSSTHVPSPSASPILSTFSSISSSSPQGTGDLAGLDRSTSERLLNTPIPSSSPSTSPLPGSSPLLTPSTASRSPISHSRSPSSHLSAPPPLPLPVRPPGSGYRGRKQSIDQPNSLLGIVPPEEDPTAIDITGPLSRPTVVEPSSPSSRDSGMVAHASGLQTSPSGENVESTSPLGGPSDRTRPIHRRMGSKETFLPTVSVSMADVGSGEDEAPEESEPHHQHHHHVGPAGGRSEDEEFESFDTVGDLSSYHPPSGLDSTANMTVAQRREHSRKHSRAHSRNLSVFFPQPGQSLGEVDESEGGDDLSGAGFGGRAPAYGPGRPEAPVIEIPSPSPASSTFGDAPSPGPSRRGHHHKHSVSHNFFSFLDPTQTNPALRSHGHTNGEAQPLGSPGDGPAHRPILNSVALGVSPSDAVGLGLVPGDEGELPNGSPDRRRSAWRASPLSPSSPFGSATAYPFPVGSSVPPSLLSQLIHLPRTLLAPLFFGSLHFTLGAALWVAGQSGDSLAVTGLGYLVVFDAFGVLSTIAALLVKARLRGAESSVRRPFGTQRIETLFHFMQSIYLIFASVYVCKESIEHVLLSGSEEHGEDEGLALPTTLLALATTFCIISNIVLRNHSKLVAAVGVSTAASAQLRSTTPAHRRTHSMLSAPSSSSAAPLLRLLANPFSLTVLFFSGVLLLASLALPPAQAAGLDKVLAGLESVSMFYIAYPASVALGKVLLQTAPNAHQKQVAAFWNAVRELETNPLVTFISPPHLWQLTPSLPSLSDGPSSSHRHRRARPSLSSSSTSTLVGTLHVKLRPQATDADVLEITRLIWEGAGRAIGAFKGGRIPGGPGGDGSQGELTVEVTREGIH